MNAAQHISTTIPAIGQPWPGQGGIYAGLMPGGDGKTYHLIRAVDDISDSIAWGKHGNSLTACDDKWDGLSNTKAMAAAGNEAAIKALSLEAEGHSDFYIPAQKQGQLLNATIPEASEKAWYWTSTQCSSLTAWFQSFGDGGSTIDYKDGTLRVCAVRRFIAD